MFDGVHLSLGLGIAVAVVVLLPITFFAISRWRKRHDENELQRLARNRPNPEDNPSWVKLAPPQPATGNTSPRSTAALTDARPKRVGFLRRLSHAFGHLLDDRKPGGNSSVAPLTTRRLAHQGLLLQRKWQGALADKRCRPILGRAC